MDKQLTVLITRPQPGADAFAAMLPDLKTVISPTMVIIPVPADLGAPDVVILTSRHAIATVAALDHQTLCYCVGTATTEKAQAAGLLARLGGETAQDTAARVLADKPKGDILYARGRHVSFDMVGALTSGGLLARELVVYDQIAQVLLPQALEVLKSGVDVVVPLFSVRSAALFFKGCPADAKLRVVAMSSSIAQTVPRQHADRLSISPNPDAKSMADTVRKAAFFVKRLEQGQ